MGLGKVPGAVGTQLFSPETRTGLHSTVWSACFVASVQKRWEGFFDQNCEEGAGCSGK